MFPGRSIDVSALVSSFGIEFEANRLGFKTETDASKRLIDRIGLGT